MASFKRKAETIGSSPDQKKPKKDATLTSFFGAPKITPAASHAGSQGVAANFDKEKWVSSLSEEQKQLLKLEIDTLDPTWLAHLKDEVTSPEFLNLKRFIRQELNAGKKIFPPMNEIYSWSRHAPLNTVRVVILGQDPYHNHNQAHGLCFSVRPPTPAPPSLQNIYKALAIDYPDFKPPPNRGGLLTPWADQGVLLLNSCLTVEAHMANSHSKMGWERFTQKVIDTVVKVRTRGVVFLAWGTPAQQRCAKISGAKHLVLKSVHPSPLSASRGFFDCGHFKKTNEWLEERYGKEGIINWNLDAKKPIKAAPTTTAVKTTADQANPTSESGPTTELATVGKKDNKPETSAEEFDGEDDADAIEALEELAQSGADNLKYDGKKTGTAEAEVDTDEKDSDKEN